MRGILVGSLTLIALEVLLQPNNSKAVGQASGWVVGFLQRLMSPNVAAIPNVAKVPLTTQKPVISGGGGGTPRASSAPLQSINPTIQV